MTIRRKPYSDMVSDSLSYLAANTDVTYLAEGSIARALVEATSLQISRHQDFVQFAVDNVYLSSASGLYLDLIGDMLGVPRITPTVAQVASTDGVVKFYVTSGTLSSVLPANSPTTVYVPANTIISNIDNTLTFAVTSPVSVPKNARSVYVSVIAQGSGSGFNVGANQLTNHNLGNTSTLKVTNVVAITTGADYESDDNYRYRLSRYWTSRFGSNRSAIQIAALSDPGVSNARVIESARGAGTFDVLLIPRGNKLTSQTIENVRQAVQDVTAFGISPKIREPFYIPFKIIVRLRFSSSIDIGIQESLKSQAQSAILSYFSSIPLGGEFIVSRLRTSVLSLSNDILDMTIEELCFDKRPRAITGFQLREDEIFTPDIESSDPVVVN